jgi:autotransporter strand-loop-strand O-heptosyltransferase
MSENTSANALSSQETLASCIDSTAAPFSASGSADDGAPQLSEAKLEYNAEPPKDAGPAAGPKQGGAPFFLPAPEIPTREGPRGIRYDFNDGARVLLPNGAWHVQIIDDETGNVLFACDADNGWVVSTKKYYVPFRIQIWDRQNTKEPLLNHPMDLKGKPVLLKFPVGTLGDLMGWFPYAERFLHKHDCILECSMGQPIIDLVKDQYPGMTFCAPPEVRMKEPYASYRIGLFFGGNQDFQPYDFRQVGLHKTAGHILGVDPEEIRPRLKLDASREIEEPYVCIAVKSTNLAKMWNNGHGWEQVINHLKSVGYRVLCIDRERTVGVGYVWNKFPDGAEDFTGDIPLQKRVDLLRYADFFVGLGSGLSWLAWGTGIPVVLISGFSLPMCEFKTPYRVHNTHVCHGCWDATDCNFDHKDYFWCPRHKGTERQFECSRAITGKQVISAIERLRKDLGFAAPKERT